MARCLYSIVEYHAEHKGYKCGYCKSPNTNFSHGMWAHSLTVQDYQSLIDRGWRRSGCYCYKPTMDQICCPLYTIKCETLDFRISKSQKKILKRMVRFLRNEAINDNVTDISEDQGDNIDINNDASIYAKHLVKTQKNVSTISSVLSVADNEFGGELSTDAAEVSNLQIFKNSTSVSSSDQERLKTSDNKSTLHCRYNITDAVPRKKAKFLRIERKRNKLLAQGKSQSEIESILKEKKQNCAKSLEELFDEVCTGLRKLELRLVRTAPMSSEYLKTSKKSYEVYKKYQTTIHGMPAEKVTVQQYTRFLVKSPLQQWIPDSGGPIQGYGSFHEQYWLDNELIAVGVIDILPSCVSSVYFFYDPAYRQLSLGTFSSLREIHLTRQLNRIASELRYYYMGFYIHTCPKMRYKARMRPSKLLCPETYTWFDIEACLAKLDKEKYSRLNDNIDAIDENGVVDIREVLVLYNEIAMPYKIYKTRLSRQITRKEEREVKEYAGFVGMPCAKRMLLYRI